MTQYKLSIGDPKSKKTHKIELSEEQSANLRSKRIGEKVDGGPLGLPGYEFELTGGSDDCGFPMRRDVDGPSRRRILAIKGTGIKKNPFKGRRIRKTVAGNTVGLHTVQVNLKVLKHGKQPLGEEPAPEGEQAAPKQEAPAKDEKPEQKDGEKE